MPINRLHIENFRGIAEKIDVDIKPITIFVGPNSSGKSSCIHALACLSQTVKIVADKRPLVLDDETANVHLGRFIEVIHSKSYQDQIGLGISLKNTEISDFEFVEKNGEREVIRKNVTKDLTCFYKFKCSKRTQEITLENFDITYGDPLFSGKKQGDNYSVLMKNNKHQIPVADTLSQGFMFDPTLLYVNTSKTSISPVEFLPIQYIQAHVQQELSNTLYLGPFRQPPSRRYDSRGAAPSEVGSLGESTITMLANETIQSRSRPHLLQISKWLAHMKLAKGIDVNRIGSSDLFKVDLTLSDGNKFPLADLGYGLSQVLPVLTQCSFAPKNSTLLFEQPELHVHPLACKGLSQVFIDTVKQKKANILLETHSPDLLRSFFKAVGDGRLSKDDLKIYNVRRKANQTQLQAIDVDQYGDNYENWEKDLCFE